MFISTTTSQPLLISLVRLPELNARYNWAKEEIPLKEKAVVLMPESSIPKGKDVQKPFTGKMKEFVVKALANEDTLLRTHCCRHKCFPVCSRAQHLLRTQILCPRHKKCF